MNQLNKPLVSRDFYSVQDQIVALVTKLQNRNDVLQKNTNQQSDPEFNKQIKKQRDAMKKDIDQIKQLLIDFTKYAKTPQQKSDLKTLREQSQQEMDRYSRIIRDLVRQSYDSRLDSARQSIGNSHDDTNEYLTHDAKIDISDDKSNGNKPGQQSVAKNSQTSKSNNNQYSDDNQRRNNNSDEQEAYQEIQQISEQDKMIMDNAELQRQIMEQRQQEMDQLEKDINVMQDMFVDVAGMISKQGEVLDVIDENIDDTGKEIQTANKNINQADSYQKSANKQMYWLIFLAILIIAIGLTVYFVHYYKQ